MRVKILKRGDIPLEINDFDLVLIETEAGTPISVVSRFGPEGAYVVSNVDDEAKFHKVLQQLGLDTKLTIVNANNLMKSSSSLGSIL